MNNLNLLLKKLGMNNSLQEQRKEFLMQQRQQRRS
jgi:hypothetical protein